MNLKQITHRLYTPEANIESGQAQRLWSACERAYTFQPIYRTSGRLMAVEMLTAITDREDISKRVRPDHYFAEITIAQRVEVVREQLSLLEHLESLFLQFNILASVNIDGPTLLALRQEPVMLARIARLPWIRFELVEHIRLPSNASLAGMSEFGPLWLDDFGTGMANFSSLSEVRYDYIKVARELFIMLRKTAEGRHLFTLLLQLMNRYCNGVIVEGVETAEEWRAVQASPAMAAQGYFLSRPQSFSNLEHVLLQLV